jgi:hypothetical protein
MKTIINPAGGDIKNVHCQSDPSDAGATQLRACLRAATRGRFSATRGAAAAHFNRLR